ncbi:MAG: peptidoglycan DD-metalloendopeptidase family protein [Pseudomonadales bacterium]
MTSNTSILRLFKTLICGLVAGSSSLFAAINLPPHSPVPGGIAVLDLPEQSASENDNLSASYRGARVMLVSPMETGTKHWQAIVGIPLSAKPGHHQLTITSDQGKQSGVTFDVNKKTYKEQRITLTNKRQVNPYAADLERIKREKRLMVAAFKDWNTSLTPTMTLTKPTIGPLSSPFGLRRFFNDQPRNPHSGLDFAAPEGTAIQAPAEAIVVATGDYFFNGNTVLLDHGHGLVTMYCHMSRIDVSKGDHVQLDDTIGLVGKTGRVTGAHLHWSVSLNNARIDPNLLMPKEPKTDSSTP